MAISKEKKKEISQKLKDIFSNSQSVVFVNFHNLKVNDANRVRSHLKENGIQYFVTKKTLIKRVLGDFGFDGEIPELSGEIALAYGDDLIAPAREIYSFRKELENSVSIVGGIFDKKYIGQEEMLSVASIPSKPVLYGQFVNLINSPIQQFVSALGQIAEKKEA